MSDTVIKFGTGGWRAVIGDDFVKENIVRVASGIVMLAREENKTDKPIIIGFDRRFLSPEAAKWCAEVFSAAGINVLFLNRSAPTPLIMHTVLDMGLYYGIEITASHNPSQYNGIKLFTEGGRDASVDVTRRLEELIASYSGEIACTDFDSAVEKGLITYVKNPFNRFIDSIIDKLDMNVIRERGPRILFDPMHGSGTYPIMVILYTARTTLDLIHSNKDAFFGGESPAPSRPSLSDLSDRVKKGGYDLGIAVDGDGDRLGIIDSNGNYIDANQILVMLYYYLHEYKGWKGPVVRNLATTHMLDAIAHSLGEECYEVPVGFKYISDKIEKTDAVLGGESSGGLTVRGHINGKDSIYSSSLFIEMFSAVGMTPTEFYASLQEKYGTYVLVEDNMRFNASEYDTIKKALYDIRKESSPFDSDLVERVGREDGVKVYFKDSSFVIARFSGTEPLLRIFAEAKNDSIASGYIMAVKRYVFDKTGIEL